MFNEALGLLINAKDNVFEAEKMTAANYAGNEENLAIQKKAMAIYSEKTGLKASTRRLYDLALKLYVEKYGGKK